MNASKRIVSLMLTLMMVFSVFGGSMITAQGAAPEDVPVAEEGIDSVQPESTPDSSEDTGEDSLPDSLPEVPTEEPEESAEEPAAETAEAPLLETEALLALARDDGAAAAEMLNALDNDAFAEGLRLVLDLYYGEDGYAGQLAAFIEAVDARADEALAAYAAAAEERARAAELGYVGGEVLVVFQGDVAGGEAMAVAAEHDTELAETWEAPDEEVAAVAELPLDVTVGEAMAEFEADPAVSYAQPLYLYESAATVDDPGYASQSYMTTINALKAWEAIYSGVPASDRTAARKVRVAVIDNPIDIGWDASGSISGHADLRAAFAMAAEKKMRANFSAFEIGDAEVPEHHYYAETDGHGTHMAGIIGATANNKKGIAGVASGMANEFVDLIPINVFEMSPSSLYYNYANSAGVAGAITYASKYCGAKVINLSLFFTGSITPNDTYIQTAISAARTTYDAVVVASVASRGSTEASFPADAAGVLGVINLKQESTATQSATKGSYTSTTVSPRYATSNYGRQYISAPGTNVYSTMKGGYQYLTGTSCAAAVVSGVAALVRYANPNLSEAQVRRLLQSTACDTYTPGVDEETGYGCVDAEAAVKEALGGDIQLWVAGVSADGQGVTLGWEAPGGDSTQINIYRNGTKIADGATNSTYLDNMTQPYTKYTYQAKLKSDENKVSALVDVIPATAPGLAAANRKNGAIAVSWMRPAGATGEITYRVYVNTNATGSDANATYAKVQEFKSSDELGDWDYTDTKAGIDYSFRIEALVTVGTDVVTSPSSTAPTVGAAFPAVTLNCTALSATSIELSWGKSIIWVSPIAPPDGYYLYRAEALYGSYKRIATVPPSGDYVDSGLSPAKDYHYYLVGFTKFGTKTRVGDQGDVLFARTLLDAPQNLAAAPQADGSVKLTWSKVAGADGYELVNTGTNAVLAVVAGSATTSAVLSESLDNVSVAVRAYRDRNGVRDVSANSSAVGPLSIAPAAPVLRVTGTSAASVGLAWTAPAGNITSCHVFGSTGRRTDPAEITELDHSTTDTTHTFTGLAPGTYSFYVATGNAGGQSNSNIVVVTIGAATQPSGFTAASAGYEGIALGWTAGTGVDGYQLYRATSQAGPYTLAGTAAGAGANACTDTGLIVGQTYHYRLYAYTLDAGGQKVLSGTYLTAFARPEFDTPALTTEYTGYYKTTFKWTQVPGASGYELWQGSPGGGAGSKKLATITKGTTLSKAISPVTDEMVHYGVSLRSYRTIGGKKYYGGGGVFSSILKKPEMTTATAAVTSELNTVELNWAKPADYAVSNPAVSGYNIYRFDGSIGSLVLVKRITNGNTITYTDKLAPSGSQAYWVSAYCTIGGKRYEGPAKAANAVNVPGLPATTITTVPAGKLNSVYVNGIPRPQYAAGIRIYRMAPGESEYKYLATVKATSTWTYEDKTAPIGPNTYKAVAYYTRGGKVVEGLVDAGSVQSATATGLGPVGGISLADKRAGWIGDKTLYYTIRLTWNMHSEAGGYFVYRSTNGGDYELVKTLTGKKSTKFTDSALPTGGSDEATSNKYTYKIAPYRTVSGKKVAGQATEYNTVVGRSIGIEGVTRVSAVPTSAANALLVTWDRVADASGYFIYDSINGATWDLAGSVAGATKTSFTHKNIDAGLTTLQYCVVPYRTVAKQKMTTDEPGIGKNAASQGAVSAAVSPLRLAAPTGLKAQAGTHSVKLTWTRDAKASGYAIYRATSYNGNYQLVKRVGKVGTYTDRPLDAENYYYRVAPYTKSGKVIIEGAPSTTSAAPTPLAAVTNLSAQSTSATKDKVSWTKVSGASGYYVYRVGTSGEGVRVASTTKSSITVTYSASHSYYVVPYYKVGGKVATGTASQPVTAA